MDDYLEDIVASRDERLDFLDSVDACDNEANKYWVDDLDRELLSLLDNELLDDELFDDLLDDEPGWGEDLEAEIHTVQ